MSLTKEDLKAISDLIEAKLNEQDKRFDEQDMKFDKKLDEQKYRLMMEILEIKNATAMNSYDIATIKPLVMRKTS